MGERLGLVPGQEVDVAGRGLPLQQLEAQPGAVDRVRVLPALEGVPRPAPAVAPFLSTTLRWPGEIVAPVRAATSAASRASVHTGRSATGAASRSRATESVASRLRGAGPVAGAAPRSRRIAPPSASAAPARPACPRPVRLAPHRRAARPFQLSAPVRVDRQRAPSTRAVPLPPLPAPDPGAYAFILRPT